MDAYGRVLCGTLPDRRVVERVGVLVRRTVLRGLDDT